MTNFKRLITYLLCVCLAIACSAQEYRVGLERNVQLIENPALKVENSAIKITLPLFDNFKQKSVLPNPSLWSDGQVFINSSYQLDPPNRGVATFDALNSEGYVYKHANDVSFFADSLTSNYIQLGAVKTSDSLYFSFFYQPQGSGDRPEVQDSLMVEFQMKEKDTIVVVQDSLTEEGETVQITKTVIKDKWFRVFADRGHDVEEFKLINGKYWKLIMIKVDHTIFNLYIEKIVRAAIIYYINAYKDEHNGASPPDSEIEELSSSLTAELNEKYDKEFLHDEFRIRFLNKASISPSALKSWQGNCDQWNIDNVYLNINRTKDDTLYAEEIGFIKPARSFLKNYTAVPYRQYNNNPIAYLPESINTFIYNGFKFDDTGENFLYYKYKIYSKDDRLLYTYAARGETKSQSYVLDPQIATPPMDYVFPVNKDYETPFKIVQTVNYEDTDKDEITQYSDIIEYNQSITNYFAYDDGTAELGYGLKGAGAMCAVRYELNTKDTLIGVRMYFNNTLENANEKPFRIAVWRDNDLGKPGEMIYLDSTTSMPEYTGENQFIDFSLDNHLEVRPTNLYVGWLQVYKENLNIGWDTSNPQREMIFVNIPGENGWRTTDYDDGCLMIRPLFKSKFPTQIPSLEDDEMDFTIYPNPVTGSQFSIHNTKWNPDDMVEIYSLDGRVVYSKGITTISNDQSVIVCCDLKRGMHIVRIVDGKTGKYKSKKIIVN